MNEKSSFRIGIKIMNDNMYKTLLKSIGANNDILHEAVEEDDIKRIKELSTYNDFNVDVLRRHDQKKRTNKPGS